MSINPLEWWAQDSPMSQSIDLFGFHGRGRQRYYVTTEFNLNEHEEGKIVSEPTLRLAPEEAQQIMNELWRIGIRPKDGTNSIAQTEALSRHLEDMRTIAFNRLKIDK